MTYSFYAETKNETPQTQPIPGRESEMIQGRSGGYAFDPGVWTMLRRCLITGTAQPTYYAGKKELTDDFARVVKEAIALDPAKVAAEILYASDGHAINNSAPIFALVLLSMGESKEAKAAFKEIFLKVVRTGSHFHEWMAYTKQLRGIGRTIKEVALSWLAKGDVRSLTYQFLKYGQRNGFSFRDELRLFKPVPPTPAHSYLYGWTAGRFEWSGAEPSPEWTEKDFPTIQLEWYEWLKRNPSQGERAVREGRLTHEMIAPIAQMTPAVWQALFEEMPVTAMLRNLGSLTEIGVLRVDAIANLNRIESVLNNRDTLKKAHIHPLDVLKALKTYQSGGRLGRSRKTWVSVPRITDMLEKALELAFESQEPTGKVFLHAIDVSGSMSSPVSDSVGLACCEVAATMALVSAKAEKNYVIRGFSSQFKDLGITAMDSFSSACRKTRDNNFGSTDASVAYDWAIAQNIHIDVFCFWTDSESWAGYRHPSQALEDYRRRVNPAAKAVYTTLTPYRQSLADTKDANSWDFSGFDPAIPRLIQAIALGEV